VENAQAQEIGSYFLERARYYALRMILHYIYVHIHIYIYIYIYIYRVEMQNVQFDWTDADWSWKFDKRAASFRGESIEPRKEAIMDSPSTMADSVAQDTWDTSHASR